MVSRPPHVRRWRATADSRPSHHRPEQRKLEIMVGDFVKADLPFFDVCISNTPYQVRPRPLWLPCS